MPPCPRCNSSECRAIVSNKESKGSDVGNDIDYYALARFLPVYCILIAGARYFTAEHGSCSGLWDRIKREHSYYGRQRLFSRRASC